MAPVDSNQFEPGLVLPDEVGPPPVNQRTAEQSSSLRYHHLDAVRAFALLLGVFFHAAESFGPRNNYWAIVDCAPSGFLEWVRFACHSFRLELFFVIAGFFARLVLVRRGAVAFVRNRTARILVPLVIGWVLLYPVLVSLWLWGWSITGHLKQLVPPEAIHLPIWQLTLGFFLTGEFFRKFDLTHLWFLHQLLVIYGLFLASRWMVSKADRTGTMMRRADGLFARLINWPGALLGFSLPTIPMLLVMNSWGVDTPKESLLPHLPTTLLFGFCFLAGWLFHRQPALLDRLVPRWHWHLALGAGFWITFGLLDKEANYRGLSSEAMRWAHLAFASFYAQMMWGFALGFLGLFTRFFREVSTWTRYIADSSYWIYVAHLPLIVALQVMLGRVALPWQIKYPFICAVSFVLLFASYHFLVRGTFIGAQLNGRRYPLAWPWQRERAAQPMPVR